MATTIPTVIAAFETALGTVGALTGVSITRGEPGDQRHSEGIMFLDAEAEREYASLGTQPTPLREDLSLDFGAWVIYHGQTEYDTAETRLWVLFDALEDKLRTDLSLGNAWMFGRITDIKRSYVPVDKGKAAQVTFTCEGTAYI